MGRTPLHLLGWLATALVASACSSSSSAGSEAALDASPAATITCADRVLARGPAAPDLEALCAGSSDCTEVRDVLLTGCPNTLFCTCGSGVCYGTTSSAVGCGDAGARQQCGDRLCDADQYCAITVHAAAPADGGARSEFRCAPLPTTCAGTSTCECLLPTAPGCTCTMANGGVHRDAYVTCSGR